MSPQKLSQDTKLHTVPKNSSKSPEHSYFSVWCLIIRQLLELLFHSEQQTKASGNNSNESLKGLIGMRGWRGVSDTAYACKLKTQESVLCKLFRQCCGMRVWDHFHFHDLCPFSRFYLSSGLKLKDSWLVLYIQLIRPMFPTDPTQCEFRQGGGSAK